MHRPYIHNTSMGGKTWFIAMVHQYNAFPYSLYMVFGIHAIRPPGPVVANNSKAPEVSTNTSSWTGKGWPSQPQQTAILSVDISRTPTASRKGPAESP